MNQASHLIKEILRRDVFHPRMKYLYGKYYPGYAGIPSSTNWDSMKNVLVSDKRNKKFMKRKTLVFWSRLLSRPVCYLVSPVI